MWTLVIINVSRERKEKVHQCVRNRGEENIYKDAGEKGVEKRGGRKEGRRKKGNGKGAGGG